MHRPTRRVLAIFSLNLVIFFLARVGLFLVYPEDFHDLTLLETLRAFARGLLFDASIIMFITGGPLLMMLVPFVYVQQPHRLRLSTWAWANAAVAGLILLPALLVYYQIAGGINTVYPLAGFFIGAVALLMLLPFRLAHHRTWIHFWTWVNFALLIFFLLLLAGNVLYFGFVHRHAGPEIIALGGDVGLMLDMALGSYWWALLLFLSACIGLFFLWRRFFQHHVEIEVGRFVPGLSILVIALLSVAMLIRGGLGGKPLDIVDAFVENHPSAAYLSLNGPFTIARALLNTKRIKADFFAWDEAVRRTQELVLASGERLLAGGDYPLLRARTAATARKSNVVVLMLESWDAVHIDVLRRGMNLKPYGATPSFDALARQGLLFTHFYANGERSMDGLAALIAGIPTLPGTAYIGMGMEQNRMAYLGHMAQQEGYETIFLQSSKRESFHVDSIAAMAGFTRYLGSEDIPVTGHSTNTTERGAWDHDTFQEANNLFAKAKKPFMGFVFTASTHLPFQSPGKRWQKHSPDTLENRFLNSLYYADWALGEFIAAAKKSGYYDNTIFILTADHVSGFAGKASDVPGMHHVPLLVVAPGLKSGTTSRVGGQVDIIPTLAELAGWRAPQASLGHSLLDTRNDATRGTLCVRGNVIERIENDGWVTHDLTRRVNASVGTHEADLIIMEERLLAMYQVGHTLLLNNRIFLPDSRPPGTGVTR
jgi:phosphoglycerol transferase MdoB-like AlkP superfamily enzyme